MNLTFESLQKYFNDDFQSIDSLMKEVLIPIFGDKSEETYIDTLIEQNDLTHLADKNNIKQIIYLGKLAMVPSDISLYEVIVKDNCDLVRARVGIQRIVRTFTENISSAFIVFRYETPADKPWRFSYLEKGTSLKDSTPAKRYTYLMGKKYVSKTAADRFYKLYQLKGSLTPALIKEAFSVEALTKEFYNELYKWYEWTISDERGITFPNLTNTPDDDRENIDVKIIRLITRFLFVWFIKQKNLVPDDLFEEKKLKKILKDFSADSSDNGDYYNAILQNLFFATLNKEVNNRGFAPQNDNKREIKTLYRYQEMFKIDPDEVIKLFATIPFLNGGLFECLDKTEQMDGVQLAFDGFSRNTTKFKSGAFKHRAYIPNTVFFNQSNGLIPLLRRYNFTVEENTPDDIQVALDPELLGKVFENLLGSYNEETRTTARNQSGSFYTPREIVDYMVKESLKAFIKSKCSELNDEDLYLLFNSDNLPQKLIKNKRLRDDLITKLKELKILDPACGSGAFNMGILNVMVYLINKLSHSDHIDIYDTKLELIRNCIYGVDLQNIAVQISKLRFFISLICEQDSINDKPEENYGVHTLPNLENNFIAANTLVSIIIEKGNYRLFENKEIDKIKAKIQENRKKHFNASSSSEKISLRTEYKEMQSKLISIEENDDKNSKDTLEQLASWNPYDQNASSDFFEPDWMFGIPTSQDKEGTEGFDIIIGNPPYINMRANNCKLSNYYREYNYETFKPIGDIYPLFYEKAYYLLKHKGILCFITSNKWMRAGYGESLRDFLSKKTNPIQLIDFGGVKVFESATVDTNILLYSKEDNKGRTLSLTMKRTDQKEMKDLETFIKANASYSRFIDKEPWVILSEIEQRIREKIEAKGIALKDWKISFNVGVMTGLNEAFYIDTNKRNEFLANCESEEERKRTEELIKPILRGRDINRYTYNWAGMWLITTLPAKSVKIDDYPAVKKYLASFGKKILNLGEKGTRKKTNHKWYETQDTIAYWEAFSKPKVVWNRIASEKTFAYVEETMYIQDSMHFITGEHLKYICAVLNSQAFNLLLKAQIGEAAGGNAGNASNVKDLKLYKPDSAFEDKIVKLFDNKKYKEIDTLLYKHYNLSSEEISYIETSH